MATVIDALLVTLALDPSAFIKGQKAAGDSFKKTKDEAVKNASAMEEANTKVASSFGKITTAALELVAIFTGGKTFQSFIEGATKANTSLGMLGASLGQSPELLGAWGVAAQRMGGSAASAQGSIKNLSDMLVDFRTQGKKLPDELFLLQAKSGVNIDFMHGVEQLMVASAAAAKQLAQTDPAAANRFLSAMGIDQATAARMIQQGANIKVYLKEQAKLAPNQKDITAARSMTDAQGKLAAAYDLLAAKVMTAVAPALTWLADKLANVIKWIADWVEKNPGWTETLISVFTAMSGALVLKSIATILRLTGALTSLTGLGMGSGVLAWLGKGGLLGIMAALDAAGLVDVYQHSSAGAGEDERARHDQFNGGGKDALRKKMRAGEAADLKDGKPGRLTDNQREAFRAAREKGLSEKAARALVANMSGEGLSVPHDVHWDVSHYAHGAVQWDDVRSAAIKKHFGKAPEEMSVAEQTKAAIWEIRNNKRFAQTRQALDGDNAGAMIDALVGNYESPANKGSAIARRSQIFKGLGNLGIMKGDPSLAGKSSMLGGGARQTAALNSIANDYRATTTSSSQEMHIGSMSVHTAATDANGIAAGITKALRNNVFAQTANFGPA